MDPSLTYLCDPDVNSNSNEKNDATFDGKNGVRSIKISPNGKHLASGDRSGNIRVFDFENQQEICKIEAHDAEVLAIEYSKELPNGKYLMASASRDRLIHVFDVTEQYSFRQTLDDHSSSITSVKFIPDQERKCLQMVTCGADKSIIFRKCPLDVNEINFKRHHHIVEKTTLYDIDVDREESNVLIACQDRIVRVYNVESGKNSNFFKGSLSDDGTLIKAVLDPSGRYVATSCTDKSLYIYDYLTGECLAATNGHSEIITGLKFTNNGRHLISVSGDSCIFIWKLPNDMANNIALKLGLPPVPPEKPANITSKMVDKNAIENDKYGSSGTGSPTSQYRFNMTALPSWAKRQMNDQLDNHSKDQQLGANSLPSHMQPKGRWAQRMENSQNLIVKSYLNSDAVIPYPNPNSNSMLRSLESSSNEDSMPSKDDNSFSPMRHATDSSSASGSWRNEEDEEDGNVNETSSGLVYYPQNESLTASTYEIRETTENELSDKFRKLRRSKSNFDRYGAGGLMPSVSVPNFNELHSDDEDSTTQGCESDKSGPIVTKNPLYMSTENLERLDQRERFMKSNFENMDKEIISQVNKPNVNNDINNRSSISAKYLSKSFNQSSPGSFVKPPVTKRREELTKAINEARKKLETVSTFVNMFTYCHSSLSCFIL